MTRRSYHLPPNIDQALAQHAKARGTTPSAIVRDALSAYLLVEGAIQRVNIELDALREEQRACLLLIKELIALLTARPQPIGTSVITDRVRARFDQLINKEEQHGNGNR